MGWNGSASVIRSDGTRTGATVWGDARDASVRVLADDHDAHDEDLANAIENCLALDGQNSPTATIDWDEQSLTGVGALTVLSTNAGAAVGPKLTIDRNSVSPADNDVLGAVVFRGRDDGATATDYAGLRAEAADVTDTTEDGRLYMDVMVAGSSKAVFKVGAGQAATLASDDSGASVGPTLTLHRNSSSPAANDVLGGLSFDGEDSGSNQTSYAQINAIASVVTDASENGILTFNLASSGTLTEAARLGTANLLVGKSTASLATVGVEAALLGRLRATVDGGTCIEVNRLTNDGTLIDLQQAGSSEGTISVSGTTITYGTFTGAHLTQWADPAQVDPSRGTLISATGDPYERKQIVDSSGGKRRQRKGDVPATGERLVDAPKPQLVKCAVTSTRADKAVYGLFDRRDPETNDIHVLSLGTAQVRFKGPAEVGDLIQASATPGVGERQPDDAVRSKTVGKLTAGDARTDERLLPCVLYCG